MARLTNDRGSALLIVLLLMGMLSIVSIMSVDRATTDVELSYNQLHADQALYIAEAGVHRAIAELNVDSSWRQGFVDEPFANGSYTVELIDSLTDPALADTIIVHSIGRIGASEAAAGLEAWVVRAAAYPFQYALFGDMSIEVETSCTDSYNSDSGSYAATLDTVYGDVGSNGFVNIHSGSVIGGDVLTSTPGGISISGSTVLGDTSSTADPQTLDAVADSEFVWAASVSNAPAGLSGSYTYDPVTKALRFDSLVLASGVYFFSSIHGDSLSSLTLAPGASVTIYVTGEFEIEHNSSVNLGGKPSNFVVYSKGSEFEVEHDSQFYGVFYGPQAEFEIEHSSATYGSIVAREIEMEDNSCFHFDRSLVDLSKGVGEGFEIAWWREIEVSGGGGGGGCCP